MVVAVIARRQRLIGMGRGRFPPVEMCPRPVSRGCLQQRTWNRPSAPFAQPLHDARSSEPGHTPRGGTALTQAGSVALAAAKGPWHHAVGATCPYTNDGISIRHTADVAMTVLVLLLAGRAADNSGQSTGAGLPTVSSSDAEPTDPPDAERACAPAESAAKEYGATQLTAAFETTVEALQAWQPEGQSRTPEGAASTAWLCYFTGELTTISKSPPVPLEGEPSEPFNRVAFVLAHGDAPLHSFSYADSEPTAPPGSDKLAADG